MSNPRKPAQRRPGPPCPVCRHAEVGIIDLAIAAGVEARSEIGRRHNLDRTALYRHAHGGHLDDVLIEHAAVAVAEAAEGLVARIVALCDRLERRLARRDIDESATDADVARLARELRSVLDLFARVSGRLVERVEISEPAGRWRDSEVIAVLDSILAALQPEWPEAVEAARHQITIALAGSTERAST